MTEDIEHVAAYKGGTQVVEQSERRDRGLAIRTEVLGQDYVQASRQAATPFSAELQDFLAENCWGLVWDRPGLDRRTRSLITLTALAATCKWTEFHAHLRGALHNGCTEQEIKETLLHIGVYLGVPTAVEGFRVAAPVMDQPADSRDVQGT